MIGHWRLVALAAALALAVVLNFCFNTVLNVRWQAAYANDGNAHGYPTKCPVGFVQSVGWPFESYEFVEGKLDFLRSPHDGFRLETVSEKGYRALYDSDRYDTGMTGAREKWSVPGVCGNGLAALAATALLVAPATILTRRLRSAS